MILWKASLPVRRERSRYSKLPPTTRARWCKPIARRCTCLRKTATRRATPGPISSRPKALLRHNPKHRRVNGVLLQRWQPGLAATSTPPLICTRSRRVNSRATWPRSNSASTTPSTAATCVPCWAWRSPSCLPRMMCPTSTAWRLLAGKSATRCWKPNAPRAAPSPCAARSLGRTTPWPMCC